MSRTQKHQSGSKNPARKFLEWKSSKKGWSYYDKAKEEEVLIPHGDIAFIVLDQLNTVKGFDEKAGSGIWSNEVRACGTEPFTIRNKNGIITEGLWKNIKGTNGAKFTKSVYAMAKIDGEYELVNFQLNGSALSAWFDFCEEAGNLEGDIVVCAKDVAEGKKGAVTYFMPTFSIVSRTLSDDAATLADKLDTELQEYLSGYMKSDTPKSHATEPTTGTPVDDPADDYVLDEEVPF